jgi:hypothetical protein
VDGVVAWVGARRIRHARTHHRIAHPYPPFGSHPGPPFLACVARKGCQILLISRQDIHVDHVSLSVPDDPRLLQLGLCPWNGVEQVVVEGNDALR